MEKESVKNLGTEKSELIKEDKNLEDHDFKIKLNMPVIEKSNAQNKSNQKTENYIAKEIIENKDQKFSEAFKKTKIKDEIVIKSKI